MLSSDFADRDISRSDGGRIGAPFDILIGRRDTVAGEHSASVGQPLLQIFLPIHGYLSNGPVSEDPLKRSGCKSREIDIPYAVCLRCGTDQLPDNIGQIRLYGAQVLIRSDREGDRRDTGPGSLEGRSKRSRIGDIESGILAVIDT